MRMVYGTLGVEIIEQSDSRSNVNQTEVKTCCNSSPSNTIISALGSLDSVVANYFRHELSDTLLQSACVPLCEPQVHVVSQILITICRRRNKTQLSRITVVLRRDLDRRDNDVRRGETVK
ncbi:hypothetical protein J6590_025474 [Homalodisca vitripennis]|nr:hypothetical protein J6590_025474 [Homalodisca vitripennis]